MPKSLLKINSKKSKRNEKKRLALNINGNSITFFFYSCTGYVFSKLRIKANICVSALPVRVLPDLETMNLAMHRMSAIVVGLLQRSLHSLCRY